MDKNDGYTQVPNRLYDAILAYGFSETQLLAVFYIVRKTYGWHVPESNISVYRLAKDTGKDRPYISHVISDLEKLNVISIERHGSWKASTMYVKDPDEWDRPVVENTHVAKNTHVGKTHRSTVVENTQGTVVKNTQVTVVENTHIKERNISSKEKGKERPVGPLFSQADEDEDDGGMSPDEVFRQWKEEKAKSGNL